MTSGRDSRVTLTRRTLLTLAGAAAVPISPLAAQQWPTRNIRMLVGTAPGGSPDIIARILAEKLGERLGVSLFVENLTTGAGAVAYHTVSKSTPDGTTMGIISAGFPPQAVLRAKSLNFDPIEGFAFVTTLCGYPLGYPGPPHPPLSSLKDSIDPPK